MPECLSVHITDATHTLNFFDKEVHFFQTLWLENGCGKEVVITGIRHAYREGPWPNVRFTERNSFRMAYTLRDSSGFFEQKGESPVNFTKGGALCKISEIGNANAVPSCGCFVLAPNEAMGFVHKVPMVFEWDGEDGVRIRGAADLETAKPVAPHDTESRDIGKKPFWEQEPEPSVNQDAANGK